MGVNNHPKKGWVALDPERVFNLSQSSRTRPPLSAQQEGRPELAMAGRVLRESRFSQDTQAIAYLAPLGSAITLRGIVYGEGFERKKECILFSLKTFSHKTVSNHSVVMLLRGLCGLEGPKVTAER